MTRHKGKLREQNEDENQQKVIHRKTSSTYADLTNLLAKKPLNVDSVYKCPCFCCSLQANCEPNNCQKLESYLMGKSPITILNRTIEVSP